MPKNVGIIGAGRIGFMLAEALVQEGYNVTLFNRKDSKRDEKIKEQFDNLQLQLQNLKKGSIKLTFDINDIKKQDLIHYVIGGPIIEEQTWFELLQANIETSKQYITKLASNNPTAIFVNLSNPVDNVTRFIHKTLKDQGFTNRVIGMGSSLDTTRLNNILNDVAINELTIANPIIKDAFVFGAHGGNLVPILSKATINSQKLLPMLTPEQIENIRKRTVETPWEIIERTGHTDVKGPTDELLKVTDLLMNKKDGYMPYTDCLKTDNVFMGRLGHFKDGKVTPLTSHETGISQTELIALSKSRKSLLEQWEQLVGKTISV